MRRQGRWLRSLAQSPAFLCQSPPYLAHVKCITSALDVDHCFEHSGDCLQVGSAQFEVNQGRQPRWKLSDRFGAKRVQDSGRAGWYLWNTLPGEVTAEDTVYLIARPFSKGSVGRLRALAAVRSCDPEVLDSCAEGGASDLVADAVPAPPRKRGRRRLERTPTGSDQRLINRASWSSSAMRHRS